MLPAGALTAPTRLRAGDRSSVTTLACASSRVGYRTKDEGGNIHVPIGKHSFEPQQLVDNAQAMIDHIVKIKPASAKGTYIKKVTLSGSMTPAVAVQV